MSKKTHGKRRIYGLYLPLTFTAALINFWRLGFFSGRAASKSSLIGIYTGFPGRNGDHMYYTSMALQFAGKSLSQSLQGATNIFHDYPDQVTKLLRGYLDPGIAPLIYPRQTLTVLMSWGYRIFGASGLGISTLFIGSVTLALLVRWSWREWGSTAAWSVSFFALGSSMFIWYGTGLFIESPLLLIEAIWLYSLPISRHFKPDRYWYYINSILILAMGFTRQSPLLPIAVLVGGWFAQYRATKKVRNAWFGISLTGSITAIATYLAINFWAPYSPIGLTNARHPSLIAGAKYLWNFFYTDPLIFIALVLAVMAAMKMRDKTLAWISLGIFLSCAINVYLATGEYRYWSPLFLVIVPLAGKTVANALRAKERASVKATKPGRILALTVVITVAIALNSLSFYASSDGPIRASVVTTDLYQSSKVIGSIGCYGPSMRIYLVQSGKKVAALDGTAMAANPGMANQLAGRAHGFTYSGLTGFIDQCMAVSGK